MSPGLGRRPERCQVAILGAGFAGSLLARVLARQGWDVLLLERGRHPRFALGESSTPLAALSLERLATRYDLPDLLAMSAHGRWVHGLPGLRRGLKRGFTFYHHRAAREFANDLENANRLLVAASPDDAIADCHWLREDVDHHLAREAAAAGVDYRDQVKITTVRPEGDGVVLLGRQGDRELAVRAAMVVDGTGPSGLLRRQLGIGSALARVRTRSALLFGHFDQVPLFSTLVGQGESRTLLPAGPYPDDWAAVHHCFEGGWIYQLRFDHGTVSAGALLSPPLAASLRNDLPNPTPGRVWSALCRRYPSIGRQMAGTVARFPVRFQPRIQHRMARAAGARWAVLPHTFAFVDPLFSTGIAWSLLGIERLGLAFEAASRAGAATPAPGALARYDDLLQREADQIDRLIHGAYRALGDFDLFRAHAMLYFAAASYAEARQRLVHRERWAWSGFLGVGDPVLEPAVAGAPRRIARALHGGKPGRARYASWVARAIAPRNIAGLADPGRRHLYPVDFDLLVERAALLGLTPERVTAARDRLRSG